MTLHNLHPDDFGNGLGRVFIRAFIAGLVIWGVLALLSGCDIVKPIEGLNT